MKYTRIIGAYPADNVKDAYHFEELQGVTGFQWSISPATSASRYTTITLENGDNAPGMYTAFPYTHLWYGVFEDQHLIWVGHSGNWPLMQEHVGFNNYEVDGFWKTEQTVVINGSPIMADVDALPGEVLDALSVPLGDVDIALGDADDLQLELFDHSLEDAPGELEDAQGKLGDLAIAGDDAEFECALTALVLEDLNNEFWDNVQEHTVVEITDDNVIEVMSDLGSWAFTSKKYTDELSYDALLLVFRFEDECDYAEITEEYLEDALATIKTLMTSEDRDIQVELHGFSFADVETGKSLLEYAVIK